MRKILYKGVVRRGEDGGEIKMIFLLGIVLGMESKIKNGLQNSLQPIDYILVVPRGLEPRFPA